MREVLQRLFLVFALIPLLFSGCATTAAPSYAIIDDRIEFPYYKLSIMRPPPDDWEMQKTLGQGELVIWLNKKAGSFIEIMATDIDIEDSYHDIAEDFNKTTCNLFKQRKPTAKCEITNETEVFFDNKPFYQVDLLYYGFSANYRNLAKIFFHRTNHYVYLFIFHEERRGLLTKEMMKSVIFLD